MEKEVSCVCCKAIFEYVKAYNNGDYSGLTRNLDPELDSHNDPVSFLGNEKNWVSTSLVIELFKRAKDILKDEMAPYNIARFLVENASLSHTHIQFIKSFWSIKKALLNVQRINDQWNRSKKVEVLKNKRNNAVIRLHWDPQINASKDLCLYNQGCYTFMPAIWGGKPLGLEEKCCYFNGAPYCEYHLTYPFLNRFNEIFSRFFTPKSTLMELIEEIEADKKIIERQYEEVNRLNLELNQKMKQLLAAQDTAKAILSIINLEQLLTTIMRTLSEIGKINRAVILLVNDRESCLEYVHGTGFENGVPEEVRDYKVPLHRVNNILVRVTNTGLPEYIPRIEDSSLRRENIMLTYGKPSSVYVVPLITRSKVIGVIAADSGDGRGIPKETRESLEIFTPQIAIAIENARLYRELEKQMLDLEKSYALLSRAEKFSFLGNLAGRLAHEINDPLKSIGSFIKMLPNKFDDEEFREHFYDVALEEVNRVNNLISELLSMVRTRESQFEFNDFHDLIDKMILLISPQSNAKNIKIIRQFDPSIAHVWLDPEKIKQVVLNILSNAVEFTPEKGRVKINTKLVVKGEKPYRICVEIRDNGIGIPETMIDKIFDPYFSVKNGQNMGNGTGLGLYIAQKNMEEHGGNIEVRSVINEGTTFILNIPVNATMGLSVS